MGWFWIIARLISKWRKWRSESTKVSELIACTEIDIINSAVRKCYLNTIVQPKRLINLRRWLCFPLVYFAAHQSHYCRNVKCFYPYQVYTKLICYNNYPWRTVPPCFCHGHLKNGILIHFHDIFDVYFRENSNRKKYVYIHKYDITICFQSVNTICIFKLYYV